MSILVIILCTILGNLFLKEMVSGTLKRHLKLKPVENKKYEN